jgi:hypothetical protein
VDFGQSPEATPAQMQRMVVMLEANKAAFAYSLIELPGYVGDPIDFQLIDPSKRMSSQQRTYTEEELQFGDEKVQAMLTASVVKEIPTTNPHAATHHSYHSHHQPACILHHAAHEESPRWLLD